MTLDDIARDCSRPNWDGYGAHPIGPRSVANAKKLMASLSVEVEITPSPSGCLDLSFEVDGEEVMIEVGDLSGSVCF